MFFYFHIICLILFDIHISWCRTGIKISLSNGYRLITILPQAVCEVVSILGTHRRIIRTILELVCIVVVTNALIDFCFIFNTNLVLCSLVVVTILVNHRVIFFPVLVSFVIVP